ncbi:MAG TPA: ABC transporter permease [Gemmatimonadaceae bacterium]|nr:ABC transporter permease [Gemmatimonadaceae bacterium]
MLPLAIAVGLLLTWELFARAGMISPLVGPAPSRIFSALVKEILTGDMGSHIAATVTRLCVGMLWGGTIGIAVGLVLGLSTYLRSAIDPFIAAAHPLPKIAVFPIIMVFFGIGELSKFASVALAVFFPLVINTMTGVRQISPVHLEVAKSYGASSRKLFTRVVIPGSIPMILSGLRIALNTALVVTISIEIVAASKGLGALIWLSWEVLRVEVLYAALFVTATLGICFNALMQFLLHRLVPWAPRRGRA